MFHLLYAKVRRFRCSAALASLALLAACSPGGREHKVMSVDEMADVVYDYQMAIALSQQDEPEGRVIEGAYVPATDSVVAASHRNYLKYRAAVFHKYSINESDYNHSLAFYLRNPEEMKKLNQRLERKVALANAAGAGTGNSGSAASDSITLWEKNNILLDAATQNRFTQETTTVGKRLKNEALLLNFDAQWLYGGSNRQAQAFVTAVYDNDSVGVMYYNIYYFQTHHEVRLPIAQRRLKKVSVQFVTTNTWENYPQVVNLSRIKLQRVKDAAPNPTTL